ncbi:MAG: hypothetical protein ABJE95_24705 [Byssovorax sp.]
MSQPIGRPASGARYIAERVEGGEGSVAYRGLVRLPDADLPLEVTITLPSGATRAVVAGGTPEHEKVAAALVRAATKAAIASGEALPRKIERWRG